MKVEKQSYSMPWCRQYFCNQSEEATVVNRVVRLFLIGLDHRVIILNRGACLAIEREESDANIPDQSVQRHSVTSLETAVSLAKGPSCGCEGLLREKYVLRYP